MSKIRVHELAKELGLQSKDIMNYLNTNGKEIKSAQSGLEDADVEAVKKHFQKKEAPKTAPKADAKKETPKKDGEAKPKKKSTITAVFNAQYSKDNHGNKKNNANRNNDNRKRDGQRDERRRTQSSNSVRPAGGLIKPRAGVDHIRRQDHAVEEPYQSPKKAQENENKNRNNERKDNARNNEKRNDNRVARQGNDNKNNDRRRQSAHRIRILIVIILEIMIETAIVPMPMWQLLLQWLNIARRVLMVPIIVTTTIGIMTVLERSRSTM